MGRSSREKGARGEREFRDVVRAHGFACERDGREADLKHAVPGVHFEVKWVEKLDLPRAIRQAEEDARPGEVPVVAFRKSRQPWRVCLPAEEYLRLLAANQPTEGDPA